MNKRRIKVFLYQPDFPHNVFYSQTKRVLYISNVVCVVQCLCFLSKFDLKEGEFTKKYSGSHLKYKICGFFCVSQVTQLLLLFVRLGASLLKLQGQLLHYFYVWIILLIRGIKKSKLWNFLRPLRPSPSPTRASCFLPNIKKICDIKKS